MDPAGTHDPVAADPADSNPVAYSSDTESPTHDPFEEPPLPNGEPPVAAAHHHAGQHQQHHKKEGEEDVSETAALLWTVDEETVLLHASDASLRHIQSRLESLLLGVSHALRTRQVRGGDSVERPDGSRSGSAARSRSRPALDFTESLRMADHAVRRLVGESFSAMEDTEVHQLVQLSALADRGAADCDELVRNAMTVLQSLTEDGTAVRSVKHFRGFVEANRAAMATEQWKHDYVTAVRSLAMGFLRQPVGIMASYGSFVHQVVEHEALYVALLRLCGGRPVGNTPQPKELPAAAAAAVAPLNGEAVAAGQSAAKEAPAQPAAKTPHAHSRAAAKTKHDSAYIHTPRKAGSLTHVRRVSGSHQAPDQQQAAEHLEAVLGYLMSGDASGPSSPAKRPSSRRASAAGPTPAQLRDLHKSVVPREGAASGGSDRQKSAAKPPLPTPKTTTYDPIPKVPQRLSVHGRSRGPLVSHY